MTENDTPDLDIDQPIPYRLTALAKRELEWERLEQKFAFCPHEYRIDRGQLSCRLCDLVKELPRGGYSVPSHLAPKGNR